jgi:putative (di)nucleoside polyphosphate hydrolase
MVSYSYSNYVDDGYRPTVGIMLVNDDKEVFVGRRIHGARGLMKDSLEAWQMPQGGIDKGENPLEAALRELKEEVGCDKVNLIAESQCWYDYQLPNHLRYELWKGQFHTVRQKWFLFHFTGKEEDIDINAYSPAEFSAWQWVSAGELVDLIVDFKKEVYKKVVKEFACYF